MPRIVLVDVMEIHLGSGFEYDLASHSLLATAYRERVGRVNLEDRYLEMR